LSRLLSLGAPRALLGAVVAAALLAAAPAVASAGQSIKLKPCASCTPPSTTFTAGGDSSVTATARLETSSAAGAPKSFKLQLASGLLSNLSSATAQTCLGNPSGTDSRDCRIGKGKLVVQGTGTIPFKSYLVMPTSGNVAGVDIVTPGPTVIPDELSLTQVSRGAFVAILEGKFHGLPVSNLTFHVNGTFPNGTPFTRMPSACTVPPTAPTRLTVVYAKKSETTNANPDVNVSSSCGSLPYAPKLKVAVVRDSQGGATVTAKLKQTAAQAANKSIKLVFPPSISPDVGADLSCLSGTPCTVGAASAVSPLAPSAALANGIVVLGGSIGAPRLTITFPAIGLSLVGKVNLGNNSVTFGPIPDLPLTKLRVHVTGTKAGKAFLTRCGSGKVVGKFTGQNGKTASSTAPYTVSGTCPRISKASLTGLAKGQPKLAFTVKHGHTAPFMPSLAIELSDGLSFATNTLKGLTVSVKVKKAMVHNGQLLIKFDKPAGSATVTITGPLLKESKKLEQEARQHTFKGLTMTVKVTDTHHTTTTLKQKLK
jgi:hypothetical protein